MELQSSGIQAIGQFQKDQYHLARNDYEQDVFSFSNKFHPKKTVTRLIQDVIVLAV